MPDRIMPIALQVSRKLARRASIVLLLMSLAPLSAQQANRPSLRLLHGTAASSLLARVDHRNLPPGSSIDDSLEQVFLLHSPNAPDLGIAALYLNVDAPNQQPSQCGVAFFPPTGTGTYVPAMGASQEEPTQLCGGVRAVGLANEPGPRPRLIVIFDHTLLHGEAFPLPSIFAWDQGKNAYVLDQATTHGLRAQTRFAGSVPAVRRLLASHP